MSDTTKAINDPYNWVRAGVFWPRCAIHASHSRGCSECIREMDEHLAALRAKVALFDVLAAREHVWQDRRLTVFNAAGQDLIYHAPTLAEAVEKAMEAEGDAR